MKKMIRLQGLVKLADSVRRDLSAPISPQGLEILRRTVVSSLKSIDQLFAREGITQAALPTPSRKALQFLRSVDFSVIKPADGTLLAQTHLPQIRFPGINRFVQVLQDRMAGVQNENDRQQIFRSITDASQRMEDDIRINNLQPSQFSQETLEIRAWLAWLSAEDNIKRYQQAIDLARQAFECVLSVLRFRLPALIKFQPMNGLYRAFERAEGTIIVLPTPMISFTRDQFRLLAEVIFANNSQKKIIIDATLEDSYLEIRNQLDELAGVVETSAGVFHDLDSSFSRVNNTYFKNSIARPRLCWTKTFTNRRFGSYDFSSDRITISATLDQSHIPEYVVDFIVYHELLHKKLGIRWQNDRRGVHTPEFLREEKKFSRYNEANAVLDKIVKS